MRILTQSTLMTVQASSRTIETSLIKMSWCWVNFRSKSFLRPNLIWIWKSWVNPVLRSSKGQNLSLISPNWRFLMQQFIRSPVTSTSTTKPSEQMSYKLPVQIHRRVHRQKKRTIYKRHLKTNQELILICTLFGEMYGLVVSPWGYFQIGRPLKCFFSTVSTPFTFWVCMCLLSNNNSFGVVCHIAHCLHP
jgi:hypothetical protein